MDKLTDDELLARERELYRLATYWPEFWPQRESAIQEMNRRGLTDLGRCP